MSKMPMNSVQARRYKRFALVLSALAIAALAFNTPARADDAPDKWKFSVAPYFWAADISLDTKINGNTVLAKDIDVSDLIDKLDYSFSVHVEAATDKGGFFFDGAWYNFSASDTRGASSGLLNGTQIDSDLTLGTYEFGTFYHPTKPGTGFDVIFGVRLIELSSDLDFELPGGQETGTTTDSSLTDAFVGIRAGGPIGSGFSFMVRGDVGTGETDLTWNAIGTVGWAFGSRKQFDVMIGWREMQIRLEDDHSETTVDTEITMNGPIAGFNWTF